MNQLIELARYDTLIEGNIAKTKLDAHDIPCFLTDEHIVSLFPSSTFPALRLFVFKKDVEKARTVLWQLAIKED